MADDHHPLDDLVELANGRLEASRGDEVRTHLARCAACHAEYEWLRALREGAREAWNEAGPGEFGWARLKAAVEGERRRAPRVRWPALAAGLVLVVQAGLIGWLWSRDEPGRYQPLGQQQAWAELQVRFAPQATEADIRALLQSAGLEISAGPGALGLYRLRARDGDARRLEAGRARLAASALVLEVRGP